MTEEPESKPQGGFSRPFGGPGIRKLTPAELAERGAEERRKRAKAEALPGDPFAAFREAVDATKAAPPEASAAEAPDPFARFRKIMDQVLPSTPGEEAPVADPFEAFRALISSPTPTPPVESAASAQDDPLDDGADLYAAWIGDDAKAESSAAPTDLQRLKQFTVVDQSGFDRPLPAVSFLVPAEWRLEGGVRWVFDASMPANGTQVWARGVSPDGQLGLDLFPGYTWSPGFGGPPPRAAAYLLGVLMPRERPRMEDVEVLAEKPFPEIARALWESQQGPLAGMGCGLSVDVARVRVRYRFAGRVWEEWLLTTVEAMTSGGVSVAASARTLGFRAPAGELDALTDLVSTLTASVRVHPEWRARVDGALGEINRIKREGAAKRAQIVRQTHEDVREIHQSIFQDRQDMMDRWHHKAVQQIRGVETWIDPTSGQQLEVNAGYKQVWSNGLDEVIVSDDPTFDPNKTTLRGRWSKLQRPPD